MTPFDEAMEHIQYCRDPGMKPQEMCRSISGAYVTDTWGTAAAILERYVANMWKNK